MSRVLIADDNKENRYMLETLLQGNGYETISAVNGEEALNLAAEYRPDLIITDILMPVMDGFALCRQMKGDESLRGTPFIFYTATYTDERDTEFGLSLGADRYLIKPLEPQEILQILEEVLAGAGTDAARYGYVSPLGEEMEFLRQHNEALFRKLEKKIADLMESNAALQREIGERQKAEESLRESEAKLKALLDCSPVGIIWANKRNEIQYVNRKFMELFGYTVGDLPTFKDFFQLAYPDSSDLASIFPWVNALEVAGEMGVSPPSFEGRLASKDGSYRDVSISGACIAELCLLVFTDNTEQKQLQEQMRQSQKLESIGNLAGEIAHDFNNILTAVTGFASMLQIKMAKNDPLIKYVNEISNTGKRGAALTHKLLAFSRKQILDIRPVDINDMLINLQGMLHRLIREDIVIHFCLLDTPLVVEADWNQLEQIVINLVTNARDAMPDGGMLTISTSSEAIDPLIAAQHGYGDLEANQFAVMKIADNGMGMDEKTQRRIFEPFFTTKATGKGTGLGLAVVYGIIRQHKGIIRVNSTPGKGTEFMLCFPLMKGKFSEDQEKNHVGEAICIGGSETILVAEDQDCLRMMQKEILESHGYKVIIAEDGNRAIEAFKKEPERISLVILDMLMPNKGGFKAYSEIAGIASGIKALFVTGYGVEEKFPEELAGKKLPLIMKPFSSYDLLKRVREVLDGNQR